MQTSFIASASLAIHAAIVANESKIEALDRAIGDGNHYKNIKRGTLAIAESYNTIIALPVDEALHTIGTLLSSTISGVSGPLFSSFFMGMAKYLQDNTMPIHTNNPNLENAAAFAYGVQCLMMRGKSNVGQKTMLDVLVPASTTFTITATQRQSIVSICNEIKNAADKGLEYTRNLTALKGRATSLGDGVIGHLDPGAKSCQVMIHAVCDLILKNNHSQYLHSKHVT